MPQPLRTFIAVELDDAIRNRALELIRQLSTSPADVKWVEAENLHFTLHFLGEIPIEDAARVCQKVKALVARMPSFEIEVGGVSAFPSVAAPRTIYVGVQQGTEELINLHAAIGHELVKLGFREESRRFMPHLTLGRVRGSQGTAELADLLRDNADDIAGVTDVSEVTVFSSNLSGRGPTYDVLAHCGLNG